MGFDHRRTDRWGHGLEHFASAGRSFEIPRELDNLGADWVREAELGLIDPAEFAAMFGRKGILQWLWMKGALLAKPRTGWNRRRWTQPTVIWECSRDIDFTEEDYPYSDYSLDPVILMVCHGGASGGG
jgi:hypothetical protein